MFKATPFLGRKRTQTLKRSEEQFKPHEEKKATIIPKAIFQSLENFVEMKKERAVCLSMAVYDISTVDPKRAAANSNYPPMVMLYCMRFIHDDTCFPLGAVEFTYDAHASASLVKFLYNFIYDLNLIELNVIMSASSAAPIFKDMIVLLTKKAPSDEAMIYTTDWGSVIHVYDLVSLMYNFQEAFYKHKEVYFFEYIKGIGLHWCRAAFHDVNIFLWLMKYNCNYITDSETANRVSLFNLNFYFIFMRAFDEGKIESATVNATNSLLNVFSPILEVFYGLFEITPDELDGIYDYFEGFRLILASLMFKGDLNTSKIKDEDISDTADSATVASTDAEDKALIHRMVQLGSRKVSLVERPELRETFRTLTAFFLLGTRARYENYIGQLKIKPKRSGRKSQQSAKSSFASSDGEDASTVFIQDDSATKTADTESTTNTVTEAQEVVASTSKEVVSSQEVSDEDVSKKKVYICDLRAVADTLRIFRSAEFVTKQKVTKTMSDPLSSAKASDLEKLRFQHRFPPEYTTSSKRDAPGTLLPLPQPVTTPDTDDSDDKFSESSHPLEPECSPVTECVPKITIVTKTDDSDPLATPLEPERITVKESGNTCTSVIPFEPKIDIFTKTGDPDPLPTPVEPECITVKKSDNTGTSAIPLEPKIVIVTKTDNLDPLPTPLKPECINVKRNDNTCTSVIPFKPKIDIFTKRDDPVPLATPLETEYIAVKKSDNTDTSAIPLGPKITTITKPDDSDTLPTSVETCVGIKKTDDPDTLETSFEAKTSPFYRKKLVSYGDNTEIIELTMPETPQQDDTESLMSELEEPLTEFDYKMLLEPGYPLYEGPEEIPEKIPGKRRAVSVKNLQKLLCAFGKLAERAKEVVDAELEDSLKAKAEVQAEQVRKSLTMLDLDAPSTSKARQQDKPMLVAPLAFEENFESIGEVYAESSTSKEAESNKEKEPEIEIEQASLPYEAICHNIENVVTTLEQEAKTDECDLDEFRLTIHNDKPTTDKPQSFIIRLPMFGASKSETLSPLIDLKDLSFNSDIEELEYSDENKLTKKKLTLKPTRNSRPLVLPKEKPLSADDLEQINRHTVKLHRVFRNKKKLEKLLCDLPACAVTDISSSQWLATLNSMLAIAAVLRKQKIEKIHANCFSVECVDYIVGVYKILKNIPTEWFCRHKYPLIDYLPIGDIFKLSSM